MTEQAELSRLFVPSKEAVRAGEFGLGFWQAEGNWGTIRYKTAPANATGSAIASHPQ